VGGSVGSFDGSPVGLGAVGVCVGSNEGASVCPLSVGESVGLFVGETSTLTTDTVGGDPRPRGSP